MECVTGTCDPEGFWRPAFTGVLIGTTRRDNVPLVRAKGNEVNHFPKFLRNADIYITSRNPPIVQFVLMSGYLDCLLEFKELIFLWT